MPVSKKNKKNRPNGGGSDQPEMTPHGNAGDMPGKDPLDELNGVTDDLSWAIEPPEDRTPTGVPIGATPVELSDVHDPDASSPEPEPEPEYEVPAPRSSSAAERMVAGTVGAPTAMPQAGSRSTLRCRVSEESEGEIGQLWSHVFFAADRSPPRGVVVTAARRGEGATQIAVSLALYGATGNRDLRIALIDFNLRGPMVADVMGLKSSPGLTEVLDGRATLEAALQAVTLPGGGELHVLAGGSTAAQPMALLKSRQLQATMARLLDRYDHVILDSASINAFPDAKMVGSLVDGAVLVTRAGQTPRETIAEAKKRLDSGGVKVLGLVLNQRTDPIPDALYQMV